MPASLEDRISHLFGFDRAILFGRARGALAALIEVEKRDGAALPVLLPSNVCPAVLAAIVGAGGTPLLVAIDSASGLADDRRLAAALSACGAERGIVMPTQLYGFWTPFDETARLARQRGWRLLENDCMATLAVDRTLKPAGETLLVSFGSGKTIDAGGGGALLTNDGALHEQLIRKAATWPVLDESAEATELHLVTARRALRQLARPEIAEALFSIDQAEIRHALPDARRQPIAEALTHFTIALDARRARLAAWDEALAGLARDLAPPAVRTVAPWRVIRRARTPDLRERIVAALRKAGFDAGTNYPPLTETYPRLLAGQAHPDAEDWGRSVVNLWLTPDYDNERIARAAALIAGIVEGEAA